jgi:hypothetical protein
MAKGFCDLAAKMPPRALARVHEKALAMMAELLLAEVIQIPVAGQEALAQGKETSKPRPRPRQRGRIPQSSKGVCRP